MRLEWSLNFLRNSFHVLDGTYEQRVPRDKFISFASRELNGLDLYHASSLLQSYIQVKYQNNETIKYLEDTFKLLDKQQKGFISRTVLLEFSKVKLKLFQKLFSKISLSDFEKLYNQIDISRDLLSSVFFFKMFICLASYVFYILK